MRQRLPWWKWLVSIALSPLSILFACAEAIWKEVLSEIPSAYRQLWRARPWGGW